MGNTQYRTLDVQKFLTPANQKYFDALKAKGITVQVSEKIGYNGLWHLTLDNDVRHFTKENPKVKVIIAPENDTNNVAMFTQMLLLLYSDFCMGTEFNAFVESLMLRGEACECLAKFSRINKVLPLFEACGFDRTLLTEYFASAEIPEMLLDSKLSNLEDSERRFLYARAYGEAVIMLYFELDPILKAEINLKYRERMKESNEILYTEFTNLFDKWISDGIIFSDLIGQYKAILDSYEEATIVNA